MYILKESNYRGNHEETSLSQGHPESQDEPMRVCNQNTSRNWITGWLLFFRKQKKKKEETWIDEVRTQESETMMEI